jgi:hypothetical protein
MYENLDASDLEHFWRTFEYHSKSCPETDYIFPVLDHINPIRPAPSFQPVFIIVSIIHFRLEKSSICVVLYKLVKVDKISSHIYLSFEIV